MDKTEIFVKMCEKAEEIQVIGKAKATELDDWYFEKTTQYFSIGSFTNEYDVWLPRQDQLQEIAFEHLKQKYPAYEDGKITGYNYNAFNLLNAFDDYVSIFHSQAILSPNHNIIETTSIEQLWLRFVMNIVYDRIWSGGEWM